MNKITYVTLKYKLNKVIPNTAVFGSTNLLTTTARRRMTPGRGWLKKDFYSGRTGPLEKFYLFIYFLFILFNF